MLVQTIQESACHYLFGKEAGEMYAGSKFSDSQVNESLDILMRINTVFLSRKDDDGFPFIDPAAFNNQCHLYSFLASKIKIDYMAKSDEEKIAKTEENRFLHLSFLLSYTFLMDRNLLCQAIETAASKGEIVLPENKKLFYDFVKDSSGTLIRTARLSLNDVFERAIKELLAAKKEQSALHHELYQISLENLRLPLGRTQTTLYTLPKIVGVALLIEEKIAFVIKTKVITSKGTAHLLYQSIPFKKDDTPVLVFEAVTSDELSMEGFRKIAESCPSYFERKPSRKHRHNESENCLFCNPSTIDALPYLETCKKATESVEDALYALAADFIKEIQTPFISFFEDTKKYPILTEIFQKSVSNIDKLGLSMKKPVAFTIDHVYLDNAAHAVSSDFRMTSSPETYLKARGYL